VKIYYYMLRHPIGIFTPRIAASTHKIPGKSIFVKAANIEWHIREMDMAPPDGDRVWSIDLGAYYYDLEELKKDLFVKELAGI